MELLQGQDSDSDSDSRTPLLSQEHEDTEPYHTFTESTGSAKELRFVMLGFKDELMDHACDIILRERAQSVIQCRQGDVCGRKISLVKIPCSRKPLASWLCFSVDRSTKDEMVDFASQVFPGPHAFLLVSDNMKANWKKHLNTITEVFGKEALDYAVFLTTGTTKPKHISSVKDCERCFHRLEDNEENVENLFRKIEIMTKSNESGFIVQSSYKQGFLAYEKEKCAENKMLLKAKEEQYAKDINELREKNTESIERMETEQRKGKEAFKSIMISEFVRLTEDDVSSDHTNLIKKLEAETNLTDIFSSIIEELEKRCTNSRAAGKVWIDLLFHNQGLLKQVEELQAIKSKLEKKLLECETQAELKEETLERYLPTDLDQLEGGLDRQDRQEELKEKMQHTTSGPEQELMFASPVLYGKVKDRPLDETAVEIKSKKEESQASESSKSGGFKHQRRDSLKSMPPTMSEDDRETYSQASGSNTESAL